MNSEEYKEARQHWLNDFHYGGTASNIFSAKNIIENSQWIGNSLGVTNLDDTIETFMDKGLSFGGNSEYILLASWLAELKVRRLATHSKEKPVSMIRDKNGKEIEPYEEWIDVLQKSIQKLIVMSALIPQDKENIAKVFQKIKHICKSAQYWLGYDDEEIDKMCVDLNIKTCVGDECD